MCCELHAKVYVLNDITQFLQRTTSDSTSPKKGLSSVAGTMSNVSSVGQDDTLEPGGLMPISTSSGGKGPLTPPAFALATVFFRVFLLLV